LGRRVHASTLRSPHQNRAELRRAHGLVLLVSLVVGAGLYFALDGPAHAAGRPTWFVVASVASWAMVAVAAVWGTVAGRCSVLDRSRAWLLCIAFGAPALLLGVSMFFVVAHPELGALHAERTGFRCMGLTFAAAACPLVGLVYVWRWSDPVHARTAGAALGAVSGACAGVLVQLWCPVAAPSHVLVGHVGPIVALALVGALFGGRVLVPRSER
jgi:negative regulator of sigma F NrsF-like protein